MTTILIVLFLGAILLASLWFAFAGLSLDVDLPLEMQIAMGLGIVFSLIVGCGLMALVFYSARKGYDEPPDLNERER
jgi:Kef-type K+ transport system membrane component KefB